MAHIYRCESIPDDMLLYEFKGDFNTKAFEDDSFTFSDQFHVYFQTSHAFYRAIKSPFLLGDSLSLGQLGSRKKHISVGPLQVFIFLKDVMYIDAWSLHYEFQKKLSQPNVGYFGEYKFYIESPSNFLENASTLIGPLKSFTLLEFSARLNQLIQHDILKVLQASSPVEKTLDNEEALYDMMKLKLEPYGIAVTSFTLNSSKQDDK